MSTMANEATSLLFLSLPNDILLNVLSRVPRRYHSVLSCVSKKLRSLVRSSELQITRSLLGKDRFYVCLEESSINFSLASYHWFTFTEKHRSLVSVPFLSPPGPYSATLTVGPEIYFVGGSRSMWILDSRSGKLRQGPRSLVARNKPAVGLVNEKIYIFGGRCQKIYYEDIQAQVFDLKTQTWQIAPNPTVKVEGLNKYLMTLGKKIYGTDGRNIIIYDTRDGRCDNIIPAKGFKSQDICVVDNVIYMYYNDFRLIWYESKEREWRVVHGLKFKGYFNCIAMADYNGKLAFLWHNINKREIWCSMIALDRSCKVAILGSVEWSDRLFSDVPPAYSLKHFTVCTDD